MREMDDLERAFLKILNEDTTGDKTTNNQTQLVEDNEAATFLEELNLLVQMTEEMHLENLRPLSDEIFGKLLPLNFNGDGICYEGEEQGEISQGDAEGYLKIDYDKGWWTVVGYDLDKNPVGAVTSSENSAERFLRLKKEYKKVEVGFGFEGLEGEFNLSDHNLSDALELSILFNKVADV